MAKTDNTNPRSYKRTVDWGAIGKQFTDAIVDTKTKQTETAKKGFEAQKERAKVKRERAERKEVFKDEAIEFARLQRANQRAIQTNTKSRNDITLAVTSQGVDKYNELFQGFKSGKISEREFLRSRQNLKDGFSNYFRIAKEYNDMKANAEKSIAEGGSKTITDFMLGQLESLQNTEELEVSFTDKGQWNVSYLDGVTQTKQEMPIETFGVIGRVNYSGFDEETAAKEIDDTIGTFTNQYGNVIKIDPRDRPDYENLIDKKLNVALGNAGQLASYLLDNIDVDENGEPFELTFDPKVAATNKNYILVTISNNDSVPTFQVSDEAKEYAKQKLKEQVEGRFDISKKVTRNRGGGSSRGGGGGGGTTSKPTFVPLSSDRELFTKLIAYEDKIGGGEGRSRLEIATGAIREKRFPMEERDEVKALLGGEFDSEGNLSVKGDKYYRPAVVRYLANTGFLPPGTELITEEKDGVLKINREALQKADQYIEGVTTGTITPPSGSNSGTGSKYKIEGKP
tara:strand:- start:31735 stop:33270 length:1536 start_codon:yes stop_codon:yes gene_type:complete